MSVDGGWAYLMDRLIDVFGIRSARKYERFLNERSDSSADVPVMPQPGGSGGASGWVKSVSDEGIDVRLGFPRERIYRLG